MSTKDDLLTMASTAEYFSMAPCELQPAYEQSHKYLARSQSTLDEDSLYTLLMQHFHLALLTGNDAVAKVTLQQLNDRFGEESPFVGVLKAEYLEATESPTVVQEYLNKRDSTDFQAFKRKTVILKQKGDYKMYIKELLRYLEVCPTDAETWCELSWAYHKTGNYNQAVYCLEEVLIQYPHAYNVFARIGEIVHIQGTVGQTTNDQLAKLKQAVQQFCRAVELCPNFVRGWSGIYVVCNKLLKWPKLSSSDQSTYQDLKKTAHGQLQAIIDKKDATDANLKAAQLVLNAS